MRAVAPRDHFRFGDPRSVLRPAARIPETTFVYRCKQFLRGTAKQLDGGHVGRLGHDLFWRRCSCRSQRTRHCPLEGRRLVLTTASLSERRFMRFCFHLRRGSDAESFGHWMAASLGSARLAPPDSKTLMPSRALLHQYVKQVGLAVSSGRPTVERLGAPKQPVLTKWAGRSWESLVRRQPHAKRLALNQMAPRSPASLPSGRVTVDTPGCLNQCPRPSAYSSRCRAPRWSIVR